LEFELMLTVSGENGAQSNISLGQIRRTEVQDMAMLGLGLSEGKELLAKLQREIGRRDGRGHHRRRHGAARCGHETVARAAADRMAAQCRALVPLGRALRGRRAVSDEALMQAALLFCSTFVVVFALGLQSLNVNGGHRLLAVLTSFLIGTSNLVLFKVMPGPTNALEIAAYLLGGPLGIVASMAAHPCLVRLLKRGVR
jgi:hypothetical protein